MELNFNITGDNTQMLQQLKAVRESIESTIDSGANAENIGKAFDDAFNEINTSLSASRKKVEELENELGDINKQLNSLGRASQITQGTEKAIKWEGLSKRKQEIEALIASYKKSQQEIERAGDALEALQQVAENPQVENSTESLRAKFRGMREELINLTLEYRAMNEEERNSAAGRELLQKITELQIKAGNLKDAMGDVSRAISSEANDVKGFKTASEAAQLAVSAWGGVSSAMQAFGLSSKSAEEIQADLQAALSASNALMQMQNILQGESNLMLWVNAQQQKVAAMAIAIKTATEGKGVIVTKLATAAQAAFNAVARANPYVLLATGIAAVVGAITLFVRKNKEEVESEKQAKEAAEKRAEAEKQAQESAAKNASEAIAKYQQLKKEWKNLRTEQQKNDFIKANSDAFSSLGVAIDGVTGAEKLFNAQTKDIVRAFQVRARAAALSTLIQKEWEEYYIQANKQATFTRATDLRDASAEELKAAGVERGVYNSYHKTNEKGNFVALTKEEKQATLAQINNNRILNSLANKRESDERRLDETNKKVAKHTNELTKLTEEANSIMNNLGLTTSSTANSNKATSNTTDLAKNLNDANEKLTETEHSQQKERMKEQREFYNKLQQQQIDLMSEGMEKELAQLNLNHDIQSENLQQQYEDDIEAEKKRQKEIYEAREEQRKAEALKSNKFYKAENFVVNEAPLNEIRNQYALLSNDLMQIQQKEINDLHTKYTNEYLQIFEDIEKKRLEIIAKYQRAREAMYEHDEQGNIKQDEQGNKMFLAGYDSSKLNQLNQQEQTELTSYDTQVASKYAEFQEFLQSITNYSLEQVQVSLDFWMSILEASENGEKTDPTVLAKARAAVAALRKEQDKLNRQQERSGVRKMSQRWEKAATAVSMCGDALQEVGNTIGGVVGEAIATSGEIISDIGGMISQISNLVNASTQGIQITSTAASTAISSVEKASVILTIISTALQIAMKIASLFNNDAKHQENIEKLQHQIDILEERYNDLGKAVDKSFSKTAARTIEEQNQLLVQQKRLVEQQLAEEKAKKKSDQDAIYDYEKQLRDLDRQIEENKEAAIDAIFGQDLQGAIEDFADAYADAWGNGESRAKAARDWVKHAIQSMIKELMKSDIANKMEELRNKMLLFWSDNVITETERRTLNIFANNMQRELDERYKWAEDIFTSADEAGGGTSGGFATMSQESADELNGRFTSLQITAQDIRAQLLASIGALTETNLLITTGNSVLREIRDIQISNNNYLADIARDTREMTAYGTYIERIARNTDRL